MSARYACVLSHCCVFFFIGQVVVSPHVYPPSITGATFLGQDLWAQCQMAFGYLQGPGYCTESAAQPVTSSQAGPNTCSVFPVVIGETGSAFATDTDKQWLQDFADFLNAEVCARVAVCGCCWWHVATSKTVQTSHALLSTCCCGCCLLCC